MRMVMSGEQRERGDDARPVEPEEVVLIRETFPTFAVIPSSVVAIHVTSHAADAFADPEKLSSWL